jgi:hypothetical protein
MPTIIQQAQDDLCRHPFTAAAAALGVAPPQGVVHSGYDLLVGQTSIGCRHPMIAQIAHFLGDQPIAEAELAPPHLNHACFPRFDRSGRSKS